MGIIRTYLKVFNIDGNYEEDFIEISRDVLSVGDIQRGVDNTEFDVGVVKNSSLKLRLRNDTGKYSDVGDFQSIFNFSRKNSIIRVDYSRNVTPLIAGFFEPGKKPLDKTVTLFEGLINDVTSASDIESQFADFTVLGYESVLSEIEVPFASIGSTDSYKDVLSKCLDMPPFRDLVSFNVLNINPGLSISIDTKVFLENKTVGEVLPRLLLDSGSVFYIKDGNAIISSREPTVDLKRTFYGQSSIDGIEDILNIPVYRDGVNRVKNFWRWKDTSLRALDSTSISVYGAQVKELESQLIEASSTVKIQSILDEYRDDFRDPKIELDLITPMNTDTIDLQILDRVKIDYPTVYEAPDGSVIARYGLSIYGENRYPFGRWNLVIDPDQVAFKIINEKLSPRNKTITFKLREI